MKESHGKRRKRNEGLIVERRQIGLHTEVCVLIQRKQRSSNTSSISSSADSKRMLDASSVHRVAECRKGNDECESKWSCQSEQQGEVIVQETRAEDTNRNMQSNISGIE